MPDDSSLEETDIAQCPRCQSLNVKPEPQKPPLRPYWRCLDCGKTGDGYEFVPALRVRLARQADDRRRSARGVLSTLYMASMLADPTGMGVRVVRASRASYGEPRRVGRRGGRSR